MFYWLSVLYQWNNWPGCIILRSISFDKILCFMFTELDRLTVKSFSAGIILSLDSKTSCSGSLFSAVFFSLNQLVPSTKLSAKRWLWPLPEKLSNLPIQIGTLAVILSMWNLKGAEAPGGETVLFMMWMHSHLNLLYGYCYLQSEYAHSTCSKEWNGNFCFLHSSAKKRSVALARF